MPGFVAGGNVRHMVGLWMEHRKQVRDLDLQKLNATSTAEIQSIESMKTAAYEELNRKLRSVGRSLF